MTWSIRERGRRYRREEKGNKEPKQQEGKCQKKKKIVYFEVLVTGNCTFAQASPSRTSTHG
jgi:hypothetical protein